MKSSKKKVSDSPWFRGAVLSVSVHLVVVLFMFFGGFGADRRAAEPEAIEGRIVSLSELEKMGSDEVSKEEINPTQPSKSKAKAPQELKKTESKKEKPAQIVEVEKPEKKAEVKIPRPEKKETPKETKKIEPEKKEPKKEDTVILNPKEEKKETPKKETPKKEEKEEKRVVKVQEPAKESEVKETENEKSDFEDRRSRLLEEMKKNLVLKDIRKGVEEREVALNESDDAGETETPANNRSGSSGGASSGVISRFYTNRISAEIQSNWVVPPNVPTDGTLEALVVFRIDKGGKVSNVKVEDSSGNPVFDKACAQVVYKTSPLTPPPPEFLEENADGIGLPCRNDPS